MWLVFWVCVILTKLEGDTKVLIFSPLLPSPRGQWSKVKTLQRQHTIPDVWKFFQHAISVHKQTQEFSFCLLSNMIKKDGRAKPGFRMNKHSHIKHMFFQSLIGDFTFWLEWKSNVLVAVRFEVKWNLRYTVLQLWSVWSRAETTRQAILPPSNSDPQQQS